MVTLFGLNRYWSPLPIAAFSTIHTLVAFPQAVPEPPMPGSADCMPPVACGWGGGAAAAAAFAVLVVGVPPPQAEADTRGRASAQQARASRLIPGKRRMTLPSLRDAWHRRAQPPFR